MKVLVVSSKYPPEYSGSGHRAHATWQRLRQRWPELTWEVVCNAVTQAGRRQEVFEGVPVMRLASPLFQHAHRIPWSGLRRIVQACQMWWEGATALWVLRQKKCDVLHVLGISPATTAAVMWSRWRRIPLLLELVNAGAAPDLNFPGLRWFWQPDLTRGAVVVAISEELGRVCVQKGLRDNVWIRANPVDEKVFYPDFAQRGTLRRALTPFQEGDRVITSVAKFIPRKNQIFLLEVLARLPDRFKLILVGPLVESGPFRERDLACFQKIEARVRELGLTSRVMLKSGHVSAAPFMRLADLYALPAWDEGLGTPMLEAMACGVPVVANAAEAAFREWIREGENGSLRPLDPAAWAEAILLVERFTPEQCMHMADAILAKATTAVIDHGYRCLLQGLTSVAPDQVLPVDTWLTHAP
ncbi:MAG: glycosyltransferase family 4 protein [Magnetococcales bacterium]|nr:glycosyltransferase family 4 protein [Magnetococcales bacterium]